MASRFCRYQLRTTDVDGARDFYVALLGGSFWDDGFDAAPLPLRAAARGAPPHWLGFIGVDDVVGAALPFMQAHAKPLGPDPSAAQAVLRDPSGATVALAPGGRIPHADRVAWHLLCARDEERALGVYADLFGWTALDSVDLGERRGRHRMFAWDRSGDAVGSATNTAGFPHVHPQWLFFFRTENLEASLAMVREWGGLTLPATRTAEGGLVGVCDDPQGAAFGLFESRGRRTAPRTSASLRVG